MTDEQLEKQISEEFEKWKSSYFSISLTYSDNEAFTECLKALALPLMKKIEEFSKEIERERKAFNLNLATERENIEELQKENEELRASLTEAIKFINEARWDNNDTPYPKHELIEWKEKFNLDKEGGK